MTDFICGIDTGGPAIIQVPDTTIVSRALQVASLVILGILPGCASPPDGREAPAVAAVAATPAADVVGRWDGQWSSRYRSGRVTLTLWREGDRLVGTQHFANLPTGWIMVPPDMQNIRWDGRTLLWDLAEIGKALLTMSPDGRQLSGEAPTRTGILHLTLTRI